MRIQRAPGSSIRALDEARRYDEEIVKLITYLIIFIVIIIYLFINLYVIKPNRTLTSSSVCYEIQKLPIMSLYHTIKTILSSIIVQFY